MVACLCDKEVDRYSPLTILQLLFVTTQIVANSRTTARSASRTISGDELHDDLDDLGLDADIEAGVVEDRGEVIITLSNYHMIGMHVMINYCINMP